METIVFEGTVTALSSIAHNGGQSFGVNTLLRREKFVQPNGTVEAVPVISGNSLRGMLRDVGMRHMCHMLGYGDEDGLELPAYYFLFSGGALTKDKTRGLDEEAARELRRLIPLVGIFGGAMGNKIMPGKVKIGKLLPICTETQHLLPDEYQRGALSVWEYVQEEMYTRKDDEKDENLRQLLTPRVRGLLADVARANLDNDQPQTDTGEHQQMRYYTETIAAGTPFYWKIVLDEPTEIEFEAFVTCLVQFSKKPYIGGNSRIGMGEVAVHFDNWYTIDSRVQAVDANDRAVDMAIGTRYQNHLETNAARIREILEAIG